MLLKLSLEKTSNACKKVENFLKGVISATYNTSENVALGSDLKEPDASLFQKKHF